MPISVSRLIPIVAVAALLSLSFAAFGHLAAPPAAERPAPFDPLSEAEQERAIAIALGSPAVDLQLGDRFQVIGASLRTDKADMMQAVPPRLADVQLYDYNNDRPLWLVVDLDAGYVREIAPTPAGYTPPLTVDEIVRADGIARAHPEVDARLADHPDAVAAGHLWHAGDEPCDVHRCLSVSYHDPDGLWGFEFFVLVDLSDEVVRDIRSPANTEVGT